MEKGNDPSKLCKICKGEGFVCENHPKIAWGYGDNCCGGAGSPCECNPIDPPVKNEITLKKERRFCLQNKKIDKYAVYDLYGSICEYTDGKKFLHIGQALRGKETAQICIKEAAFRRLLIFLGINKSYLGRLIER